MFEQNFGASSTRWLKWFIAAMAVYAVTTIWPDNKTIALIGLAFVSAGIAIARWQISKGRKGE
jgi:hypothetical protein